MVPLGLGLSITGATQGDSSVAVVIEDYMWEVHTTAGAGFLTPLAVGTVSDFHDTWDLLTISSTNDSYQPQTVATVGDEGYWDILTISSGNDGIKPLDV